jgi:hypothetical protein
MSLLADRAPSTTRAAESPSSPATLGTLTWELIFDGVWVARREGRFAGMAQGSDGQTVKLTDAHGNLCGLYPSLTEAKATLLARY